MNTLSADVQYSAAEPLTFVLIIIIRRMHCSVPSILVCVSYEPVFLFYMSCFQITMAIISTTLFLQGLNSVCDHTVSREHRHQQKPPFLALFTCTFMSHANLKIKESQRSGSYNKQVWFLRSFYRFSTVILSRLKCALEEMRAQVKCNFVL